jgi:DnaK suppressor protein
MSDRITTSRTRRTRRAPNHGATATGTFSSATVVRAPRSLTATQRRQLERELRSERDRLERSMTLLGTDGITAGSEGASSAAGDEAAGRTFALDPRTLARHEVLVDALRRLEEGRYGVCAACGTPIPFDRLLVMPETTRCVICGARP